MNGPAIPQHSVYVPEMIWYNPRTGTSCARGDVIQRTAAERTVNPTVLCFVIFPPARRCRPPTGRSCCTAPLQTDAVLLVLDPPTVPMTAGVCLYDNYQTVNVNATARHGSNITGSDHRTRRFLWFRAPRRI